MAPEKDDLHERTFQFARRIVRLCRSLPRSTVTPVLRDQLLRSGTSVGANYREARRGRSKAEFLSKAGECLRELDETLYWIELIEAEELQPTAKLKAILDETRQLIAIFVVLLKTGRSG
jgi:four helix bundle protein